MEEMRMIAEYEEDRELAREYAEDEDDLGYDEDYVLEMGFDPYEGCYTWDC